METAAVHNPNSVNGPTSQTDVTGSRVLATVYQNTLTVPKFVNVTITDAAAESFRMNAISDANPAPALVVAAIQTSASVVTQFETLSFIVLPGNYYKVVRAIGASAVIDKWIEYS